MDSDKDYTVAKEIVQSGQSGEDWDALRQSKGSWPDDERKVWKQYRHFSMDELIEMMKSYERRKGISLSNTFHPTFLPHTMAYYARNHFLSDSAAQPVPGTLFVFIAFCCGHFFSLFPFISGGACTLSVE